MFAKVLAGAAALGLSAWLGARYASSSDKKSSASSSSSSSSSSGGATATAAAPSASATPATGAGASATAAPVTAFIPPPRQAYTGWSKGKAHDLQGKVAFVTGGGGGIGRGIVEVLARCGCDVAIIDVNQSEAEKVASVVRSAGRKALVLRADVRSLTDMERAAAECVKALGSLDICVANAGIVRTGSVLTMDEKRWNEIVDVNLTGTFLTVRACTREMVKLNTKGRVILISSANAVLAGAEGGAYCATKAGVAIMCRCWAQDLIAHDITVNCIGPGATDTDLMRAQVDSAAAHDGLLKLIPMARMAEPEEVGWLTAFFASPAAAYLIGTFTLMDGGLRDHNAELTPTISEMRLLRSQQPGDKVLAKIDGDAKTAHDTWLAQREKFALK